MIYAIVIFLTITHAVLIFLADISTNQYKRNWLIASSLGIFLLIMGVSVLNFIRGNADLEFGIFDLYTFIITVGIIMPRLIATIFNQNRIAPPIVFVKQRLRHFLFWGLGFSFIAYLFVMMIRPHRYNTIEEAFVYDIDYYRSLVGHLILIIPVIIYLILYLFQRPTFCDNGLFHNGLLYGWVNFKSYTWNNDSLVLEKGWIKGTIKVWIPDEKMQAVEELVRTKLERL